MTGTKPHLSADPRKASAIIAHLSKPGNDGLSNKQAARDLRTNEAYVRRAKAVFRWGETMKIDPNIIRRDGGTQPRASINNEVVADYSELYCSGAIFPPPTVFYDGTDYWLADGFHRVLAALHARRKTVDVEVVSGDRRDAVLYSVGVNSDHGLRRTNEDKRRAVATLLMDDEWSRWSDRNISERCKVSHTFVAEMRNELLSGNGCQIGGPRTCERNGKTYDIQVDGINANRRTERTDPASGGEDGSSPKGCPVAVVPPDAIGTNMPVTASVSHPENTPTPRQLAISSISDHWPELAGMLGRPAGRSISDGTLAGIAEDLKSAHQQD